MNLSLLLAPALAGYWFLSRVYRTRYWTYRQTGYNLLFSAAITGAILSVMARLILWGFGAAGPGDFLEIAAAWWSEEIAPFNYSGTVLLTAILAHVAPPVINWFWSEEDAAKEAAVSSGNLIELVIQQGMDERVLVELSMKSGKCYIGFALESGITSPNRETDVAMVPLASGYRHAETRELELTTDYASVILQIRTKELENLAENDLRIILPKSEIASARLFDWRVYQQLRK